MKHRKKMGITIGVLVTVLVGAAVAADLNGEWNFILAADGGEYPRTIVLSVSGEQVTGKLGDEVLKGTFREGKLELSGDHNPQEAGYTAVLKLSGKLEDGKLTGTGAWDAYNLTFTAVRAE